MFHQRAASVAGHAAVVLLCLASAPASGSAGADAVRPDAGACAIADAPRGDFAMRVPFETVDGRIYVQATVDGHGPFRFAVDTGASGVGRADSSLVAALGLPLGRVEGNSDGVNAAQVDTTTFASLDVGGLVRNDVVVPTRDYRGRMAPEAAFSGIVAREFFADGLLVIDYPRKLLSFSRKRSLAPGQGGALGYERPFRIPVAIGNVRAEGNLDTGADVAFVLPRALFDRVGGTPLEAAGRGQLANTRVETQRSTVAGPFRIGQAVLRDVEVRVSDRYPELLVGAQALQQSVVLIDQRSKAVAVCGE
jgi:predicted aspartyl protease